MKLVKCNLGGEESLDKMAMHLNAKTQSQNKEAGGASQGCRLSL